MSILHIRENVAFFHKELLDLIRRQNNAWILSLLQGVNVCHVSDSFGRTLLHFAAEYANVEFARYLIDSGAKVDAEDQKKHTPLRLALENQQEATVRLLLKANADIFIPDVTGQCPLGRAFRKCNNANILKSFLDKVTVGSLKDSKHVASEVFHRSCPLYYFIQLKNAEVTKILLEKGSLINLKHPLTKESALYVAVKLNCLENVELLLKYNAHVNTKANLGQTPLSHISNMCDINDSSRLIMIKVLIAAGAKLIDRSSRKLIVAGILIRGTLEMVRVILQHSIELQFIGVDGVTPLHHLFTNRNPHIYEELMHIDFNVNVQSRLGDSLLHCAAKAGNASSIKFLLDRGADLNVKNYGDQMPLLLAIDSCEKDNTNWIECVEILLERGANPHIYTEINNRDFPQYYDFLSDDKLKLITLVFAKLVVLEASGRPIETFMRNRIESYQRFKSLFDSVKLQLEEIKQIEIYHSRTLYDFMFTNKISCFTRDESSISKLIEVIENFSAKSCYHRMLCQRFSKFNKLIEWRGTIVSVMNEIFMKLHNISVYNISEQAVGYLEEDKWKEICSYGFL